MLIIAIGVVLYAIGFKEAAVAGVFAALGFVAMNAVYKSKDALSATFVSGACLGLAIMGHYYALVAFPLLLIYLYGPMKANSLKPLWSFIFGILTPMWLYLPFYLYFNQETVRHTLTGFDFNELTNWFQQI